MMVPPSRSHSLSGGGTPFLDDMPTCYIGSKDNYRVSVKVLSITCTTHGWIDIAISLNTHRKHIIQHHVEYSSVYIVYRKIATNKFVFGPFNRDTYSQTRICHVYVRHAKQLNNEQPP